MSTTQTADNYAENTPLTKLFGNGARTKIIAALLKQTDDVNVSTIAELAGMSRSTVYDHLDDLVETGIVVQTREVGSSKLYKIDKENELAKHLAKLEWGLVKELNE